MNVKTNFFVTTATQAPPGFGPPSRRIEKRQQCADPEPSDGLRFAGRPAVKGEVSAPPAAFLPLSEGEYVFSGERPSSGAAAYVAIRRSNHSRHPLFSAVAAAEDGRAPLNRYEGEGRGEGESGALTTAVSNVTKSHGHPAGALQAVAAPIKPHLAPVRAILAAAILVAQVLCALAQTPPTPDTPAQTNTPADTNREEILRRALRDAMDRKTRASTAITSTAQPSVVSASTNLPRPTTAVSNTPATNPPPADDEEDMEVTPGKSGAEAARPPAVQPTNSTGNIPRLNASGSPAASPTAATSPPLTGPAALPNRVGALGSSSNAPATAQPGFPSGAPGLPAPPQGIRRPLGGQVPTPFTQPGATLAPPEEVIPAGTINFAGVDVNQVLEIYSKLVNRTILRPASLPAPTITLKTVTPLTRQEALQAFDAVLGLNGITMLNVGDKFVKAVPVTQANQEGAAFNQIDATNLPEVGQYVTHVVQLKYVKPSEMIQALQPFAKIPNSILPIESSQILVLRDFTENVKRMLEMIDRIDIAIPAEYKSEVIPIKYALASEIASALNSLSTGGGGTTVGGGAGAGRTGAGGRTGTSFGGRGSLGAGGTGNYPGSTPGAFGQPGINQPSTPAPGTGGSFTDRLQNIIRRAAVSGEIQILGQTKIIADERTNSLLIFASKEDMAMIKDIVSKLDVVLAQVLIEAVVIEVDLGPDSKSLGVSYLPTPQQAGNSTHFLAGGAGQFFNPGSFGSVASGATNAANALTGGFNYLGQFGNDLDVTVTAIESSSRARILQRPRIQTSHAVNATIFVGESRPYPTSSYYGGGSFGGYSSIQQLEIGVTLDVTPLINVEGLVVMDIHQTIESVNGSVTIQNVGDVPVTSRKEAQAKVAVKDKQTIMLGGLIETDKSKNASGIPILMNIPLLGYLFRSSNSSETRKELIVLIRPTVLPTPQAAADVATLEKSKMPGVVRAEQEMKLEEEKAMKDSQEQVNKKHK